MRHPAVAQGLFLLSMMAASTGVASARAAGAPPRDLEGAFAAILEMEDRRTLGNGRLEAYLASSQPLDVRERAALAAGRIGAPAASPYLLLDLLRDRSPRLRRMAAFALGEMDDPHGAPLLTGMLTDDDAPTRALAAEGLGKLKDPASVARLTRMLEDRDDEVVGITLLALWKIDAGALRAGQVERAAAIAARSTGELRRQAIYFLMRIQMGEPARADSQAALAAHAGDDDALARSFVARGLGAATNPEATRALIGLAGDKDWRVRVNAFNGLKGRPVEDDPATWPTWKTGLEDTMPPVALSALASLETRTGAEAAAALRAALADARPRWREVAAVALAARETQGAVETLAPLASDPVWSVRARAAEALALAQSAPHVAALAADSDARVRTAAMESLARLQSPDGVAALRAGLTDPDVIVRASALAALPFPDQPPAEAVGAARAAYQAAAKDTQNDARLAALDAMAKAGGETARAGLEEGLKDPDVLVRRKAAGLLRDTFRVDRMADVGEAVTRLSSGDYQEAVRRARRRVTATIETGPGPIRIELFPADAPLTVDNFIRLARSGALDNLAFHRVVPNFVIQDGDPRGDGNGGPAWQIRCEINQRRYTAGAVGMALSGKDTGGSQYFITQSPQPHLDGGYTVFGRVISGQEIVDRMIQGEPVRRVIISE